MSLFSRFGIIFARKWIGGATVEEALDSAKELNKNHENVIMNYLGEEFTDTKSINDTVLTYKKLLRKMKEQQISGSVALKPTQLGLEINYKIFLSNLSEIVSYASKCGIFVWIDMEDYTTVDNTIMAYIHISRRYKDVGLCIQSKLKRSFSDIKYLVKNNGIIRLVKGAYPSREGVSFLKKSDTDANYTKCMRYLFRNSRNFMIATHDEKIIRNAIALESKYHKRASFGMLKGIKPNLAIKLALSGDNISIYLPFGEQWLSYSIRRLKEWETSVIILKSLINWH